MRETSRHRRVGMRTLFLMLAMSSPLVLEASLWSKVKSAVHGGLFRGGDEIGSGFELAYKELNSPREQKLIQAQWAVNLRQELGSCSWLGTTYKDVPYGEQEFNRLRIEKIEEECSRLRQEHIAKKKAEESKAGGAVVEDLLDDLLAGSQKKEKDESKYLEGFDEDSVRRRVTRRVFVAQSRAVEIPALYVQTKSRDLFCLELETGLTAWVNRLETPLIDRPFETEKYLYVMEGIDCKIIDKRSGFAVEKVRFDRAVYPRVFGSGKRVYAVSYDNRILCWEWGQTYPEWTVKLDGAVNRGIYGNDNGLIAPLDSGILVSVSFDGVEQWNFISKSHSDEKVYLEKLKDQHAKALEKEQADSRREGRPEEVKYVRQHLKDIEEIDKKLSELSRRSRGKYVAEPTIFDRSLLLGNTDFQFYRLSRYTGLPDWSYTCGAEILVPAMTTPKWSWQLDGLGRLHRVDFETGKGRVIAKGVQELLGVGGDGAIFIVSGEVHLWGSNLEAVLSGKVTQNSRKLVSVKSSLMVTCNLTTGRILSYPMDDMRPLK